MDKGTEDVARHPVMGGLDALVAMLLLVGVWGLLPARWWPVDVGATLLAMALAVAGLGLLTGQVWGPRVAKGVSAAVLSVGLLLVAALAITAGNLAGLYGPVGLGGAAILGAVALLLVPYLVVFPAAQLWFLTAAGPGTDESRSPAERT